MRRVKTMSRMSQRQKMLRELASEGTSRIMPGAVPSRAVEALEAMQRIREGVYEICADCSGEIPAERLLAKPEATRCVKCQLERERQGVA
ncbi:MAG: hypothetical protein GY842_11420 [bacterium]|nr:hypothetical protein [bacterium]